MWGSVFLEEQTISVGVFSLYYSYSGCPPHFLSDFSYNIGTPEIHLSNTYTNSGLTKAAYYLSYSKSAENKAAPNHNTISPT